MVIVLIVTTVLVVLTLAGMAVVLVSANRRAATQPAQVTEAVRVAVAEVQAQASADRDAAVKAALDQVLSANRELADQQRSAADQVLGARQHAIDTQVHELRADLGKVTELVQALDRQRREQHGALDSTLKALTSNTRSLTDALASPKARGQWGERAADDILRAAGLVEGVSYEKQKAVEGGRIPDFTFFLPDQRLLHMDVKFPVAAYLRHLEAADDAGREREATAFLRDVRSRVKELTTRDYIDAERNTVDYVLCFIPNESVYGFILERDASVLEEALRQKVVFCSPSTLFAVLAVIRQAVDTLRVQEASDEILRLLGSFTKQWDKFCAQLDKVGKHLNTVQNSYDELSGTRLRVLEKPLHEIESIRRQRGLDAAGELEGEDAPALRAVGDEPW